MVRPPVARIRDLRVLGGVGELEKFRGPIRGPKRAKNAQKVDLAGLWGRSGQDALPMPVQVYQGGRARSSTTTQPQKFAQTLHTIDLDDAGRDPSRWALTW